MSVKNGVYFISMEKEPTQQPLPIKIEKGPFSGIFFEVDVLLQQARAGCIEKLRPLTTREQKQNELFASIQVNESQDFGINYNTFSKSDDPKSKEIIPNYEMYGENTIIPGLEEHIEKYIQDLDAKKVKVSNTAEDAFVKSLNKRLLAFFTECWKVAGGLNAVTPTYFSFEDDWKFIDMATGESLSQAAILKKLKNGK